MNNLTICYIGGGSQEWAVKLMRDLALEAGLAGELRLYDIDRAAAETNLHLGELLFRHSNAVSRFKVTVKEDPGEALEGADVVIVSIEPGPTQLRYADLEIPERYGILQTVGDTVGPGGILRGWRAIPTFVEFGTVIARYAPDAWIINYTNPMTVCTAAIFEGFPGAKCVGCCHEVPEMQRHIARFIGERGLGTVADSREIAVDIAGINHFTFAGRISWNGIDVLKELRAFADEPGSQDDLTSRALERRDARAWFDSDHRIALDFLRRFGAYGFAGDRHLAECVPWYLTSEAELHRYGVVRTPFWWRKEKSESRRRRVPSDEAKVLERSGEEGSDMIRALAGGAEVRTNVNLPNRGQIPWLPAGHPVETFAVVRRDVIVPEVPEALPPALEELIRRSAEVQRLTLAAALERDRIKLLQAILSDPMVVMPVARAAAMVDEMLAYLDNRVSA